MQKRIIMTLIYGLLLLLIPAQTAFCQQPIHYYTLKYPPLSIKRGNKGSGLACDLAQEINRRIGSSGSISFGTWIQSYEATLKDPAGCIFPTNLTPQRQNDFNWVGPFCTSTYYIYQSSTRTKKITDINEIQNISKIATLKNYALNETLKAQGCKNLIYYNTPKEAIIAVILGKCDICIFPEFIIDTFNRESGYSIKTIHNSPIDNSTLGSLISGRDGVQIVYGTGYESYNDITKKHRELGQSSRPDVNGRPDITPIILYSKEKLYFAVNKHVPAATITAMQKALYDIRQDGTLTRIYKNHHIDLSAMPEITAEPNAAGNQIIQFASTEKVYTGTAVNPNEINNALKKMTIYAEQFPPLTFTTKGSTFIQGATVDLITNIYNKFKQNPPEIIMNDWNKIYEKARTTPYSVICTLKRIPERENDFYWIGPYAADSAWLYARRDFSEKIDNIAAAQKIPTIFCIDKAFAYNTLVNKEFTNLKAFSNPDEVVNSMLDNPEVAGAFSSVSAPYMIRDAGYSPINVKPLIQVSQKTNYYIGISRNTPEAIAQLWQEAFSNIKETGKLQDILGRWIK